MSDATPSFRSLDPGAQVRPLSVRMTDDVRAQLDIMARLNNRSVTEEVREAIEAWIVRSKTDPKVLQRAATVKAEIERDAATKRGAIAAIFDQTDTKPAASAPKGAAAKAAAPASARAPIDDKAGE
ncbi:putative transcriptional regulator [Microbacteriaceae bacterium SG_E_30_P1]|uniref:Transcriptional regulator n=1 Tax=Antiquaquibacter oligotrophicus TaxID=2880260 RepID=A0ABT6KL77_9MICO|nr:ribbon-helix-helix protein, CopG family [Antiquaquibacter oligotrophicus]MDH6180748.1 putative transcriptional regulator [Antiquaquibacter oligotrophicus]UDF14752.1 ribbon-helix-helix domain-containing protein [Antiquaquibacter oligotrophicus]